MPLLKNNQFVTDPYREIAEDEILPHSGSFIVSFSRLTCVGGFNGLLGVRLANTVNPESLRRHFNSIALIILNFPAFTDGRSYSIARQLRLAGYRGELRAEGNLLPDQLQMMLQVGFNSFQVTDRFSLEEWQAAGRQMSLVYQRGLYRPAGEEDIWSDRHFDLALNKSQSNAN